MSFPELPSDPPDDDVVMVARDCAPRNALVRAYAHAIGQPGEVDIIDLLRCTLCWMGIDEVPLTAEEAAQLDDDGRATEADLQYHRKEA